jgi:hypothetical protein
MNRSVALGAAWSASALAAVGLGFLAVSLVDASASPGTSPAAATSTASTTPGAPSTASVPILTGEYATVAGTVYADCSSGFPVLAGAPAAGWWSDDSNDPGEFEFKSAAQKLEVHVSCVNGSPQFSDEGLRADDGGRGRGGDDGTHSSSSSSSSASSSSAGHTSGHDDSDDSSGRGSDDSGGDDNSGHGSDDSGGDDSSGRGGGGHGSDDD